MVCQPSVQKAVHQIGSFISEKDSTVRNAALNTLVILYDNIGDAVYKHVGNVSPVIPRHDHAVYTSNLFYTLSFQQKTCPCWRSALGGQPSEALPRAQVIKLLPYLKTLQPRRSKVLRLLPKNFQGQTVQLNGVVYVHLPYVHT